MQVEYYRLRQEPEGGFSVVLLLQKDGERLHAFYMKDTKFLIGGSKMKDSRFRRMRWKSMSESWQGAESLNLNKK